MERRAWEACLVRSAAWLSMQNSHDLLEYSRAVASLCQALHVEGFAPPTDPKDRGRQFVKAHLEDGSSLEVPIRMTPHGDRYVTVYEIGAALCIALLGEDPGKNEPHGRAWGLRVRALQAGVQKDRQT